MCLQIIEDTFVLWRPDLKDEDRLVFLEVHLSALRRVVSCTATKLQLEFQIDDPLYAATDAAGRWNDFDTTIDFYKDVDCSKFKERISEIIESREFPKPEETAMSNVKMSVTKSVIKLGGSSNSKYSSVIKPSYHRAPSFSSSPESPLGIKMSVTRAPIHLAHTRKSVASRGPSFSVSKAPNKHFPPKKLGTVDDNFWDFPEHDVSKDSLVPNEVPAETSLAKKIKENQEASKPDTMKEPAGKEKNAVRQSEQAKAKSVAKAASEKAKAEKRAKEKAEKREQERKKAQEKREKDRQRKQAKRDEAKRLKEAQAKAAKAKEDTKAAKAKEDAKIATAKEDAKVTKANEQAKAAKTEEDAMAAKAKEQKKSPVAKTKLSPKKGFEKDVIEESRRSPRIAKKRKLDEFMGAKEETIAALKASDGLNSLSPTTHVPTSKVGRTLPIKYGKSSVSPKDSRELRARKRQIRESLSSYEQIESSPKNKQEITSSLSVLNEISLDDLLSLDAGAPDEVLDGLDADDELQDHEEINDKNMGNTTEPDMFDDVNTIESTPMDTLPPLRLEQAPMPVFTIVEDNEQSEAEEADMSVDEAELSHAINEKGTDKEANKSSTGRRELQDEDTEKNSQESVAVKPSAVPKTPMKKIATTSTKPQENTGKTVPVSPEENGRSTDYGLPWRTDDGDQNLLLHSVDGAKKASFDDSLTTLLDGERQEYRQAKDTLHRYTGEQVHVTKSSGRLPWEVSREQLEANEKVEVVEGLMTVREQTRVILKGITKGLLKRLENIEGEVLNYESKFERWLEEALFKVRRSSAVTRKAVIELSAAPSEKVEESQRALIAWVDQLI